MREKWNESKSYVEKNVRKASENKRQEASQLATTPSL